MYRPLDTVRVEANEMAHWYGHPFITWNRPYQGTQVGVCVHCSRSMMITTDDPYVIGKLATEPCSLTRKAD